MTLKFSTSFISTSARDLALVDTLNGFFLEAVENNYSDLHFESQADDTMRVRARHDGSLHDIAMLDHSDALQVVEKVRARAKLSNIEYREPQSGKFAQHIGDKRLNIRVSVINMDREDVSIVLRIQDSDNAGLPLDKLGMTEVQQAIFSKVVHDDQGLILNTGPTGSGKTTTLYAGLQVRNSPDVKLITIEDPIEYILPGTVQIEVGTGTGKTFESVLREVLRQDPDLILVGEMRDKPSAQTGCQAAQTGHLVFSTLHANSSTETMSRLLDLNVPAYTIESVMRLFIAQRLIRKPCPHCQELTSVNRQVASWFTAEGMGVPDRVLVNHGCDSCNGKGYRGRFPIFEMLLPSKELFLAVPDPRAMLEAAREQPQFRTLQNSLFEAVTDLRASFSEIVRLHMTPDL